MEEMAPYPLEGKSMCRREAPMAAMGEMVGMLSLS